MANPNLIIVAGENQRIYTAPVGTTAPTTDAAPGVGWVDLGYITDKGVTIELDRKTKNINAWQADNVRLLTTEAPKMVKAELMESSNETLALAFPEGTWSEPTPGHFAWVPTNEFAAVERALIIDFTDLGFYYRFIFPRCALSSKVSLDFTRSDVTGVPVEFEVLAPSAGVAMSLLTDNPDVSGL